MQLEPKSSGKKSPPPAALDLDLDDFDFKPLTSGLGFSQQPKATTEIKPAFIERPVVARETPVPKPRPVAKMDSVVYQNDLSLFYGQTETLRPVPEAQPIPEKVYRKANSAERVSAYVLDLALLGSALSFMLVFMARALDMEILEAWSLYPDEVTPLVVTLFCGFYVLYFSISEKTGVTLGKSLFGIRILSMENRPVEFPMLVLRSLVTLVNFASLGLFSYFDLQNRMSDSKVVKDR